MPPFDSLSPEQQAAQIAACMSDSCQSAKAALQEAKNVILVNCDRVKRARADERDVFVKLAWSVAIFVVVAWTSLAIGLLGSVTAGVITGIFFGAAALGAVVASTIDYIEATSVLKKAQDALAAAQTNFLSAVGPVLTNCGQYCPIDLDVPQCET